nr:O-antigen ligase family protein [Acinetobacter lwoffii]
MVSEYNQDIYNSGRFRLESINPISLGHIGVILSTLSIYLFKPSKYSLLSLINILSFILGVYLTILSNSRGPLIALCFILIFILTRKYRKFFIVLPIFLFLLSFFLFYLYSFISTNYEIYTFDRFLSIGNSVNNLDDERFYLYKSAFNGFLNYPLFGYGLEDYKSGYYPHNYYIEAFMSTGFFGGVSFLLVSFYLFFKSLFFEYKYLWVSIFYIDNFISGMFSGAIYSSANFWVSLALVFSLILYSKRFNDNIS